MNNNNIVNYSQEITGKRHAMYGNRRIPYKDEKTESHRIVEIRGRLFTVGVARY